MKKDEWCQLRHKLKRGCGIAIIFVHLKPPDCDDRE